jgi:hypothetical protein
MFHETLVVCPCVSYHDAGTTAILVLFFRSHGPNRPTAPTKGAHHDGIAQDVQFLLDFPLNVGSVERITTSILGGPVNVVRLCSLNDAIDLFAGVRNGRQHGLQAPHVRPLPTFHLEITRELLEILPLSQSNVAAADERTGQRVQAAAAGDIPQNGRCRCPRLGSSVPLLQPGWTPGAGPSALTQKENEWQYHIQHSSHLQWHSFKIDRSIVDVGRCHDDEDTIVGSQSLIDGSDSS